MSILSAPSKVDFDTSRTLDVTQDASRVRLDHIDGIRGLAALYVVMAHHLQNAGDAVPGSLRPWIGWLGYGHIAVDVFIVISGYCLALPLNRKPELLSNGAGIAEYFRRRARRILPPYLVAMVLSIVIGLLVPSTASRSAGGILSHVLLLHNLHPRWIFEINPPMWSIAIEWQIYFLFPFFILPIRRWTGSIAGVLVAAFLAGMAPHFILPRDYNLDWTFPWYVGLFALGTVAAELSGGHPRKWVRVPWGWVSAILTAVVVVSTSVDAAWCRRTYMLDAVVGCASAAMLVSLARRPELLTTKCLSARVPVAIGMFSYSLYLTHVPMNWVLDAAAAWVPGADRAASALVLVAKVGIGTPILLAFACCFYHVFESPRALCSFRSCR